MTKRRRRPLKVRKPRRTVLLVVEGETELYYFNGLKILLRSHLGQNRCPRIKVEDAGGKSPEHVVRTAMGKIEQYGGLGKYLECFAIFDTEYPNRDKQESFNQAVKTAMEGGIGVVASHPCFEVWMHCHLADFTPCEFKDAKHCCDALDKKWKANRICISGYAKAKKDVFLRVQDQLQSAIEQAKNLREAHHGEVEHTADANASTDIYRLIEYLQGVTPKYKPYVGAGS